MRSKVWIIVAAFASLPGFVRAQAVIDESVVIEADGIGLINDLPPQVDTERERAIVDAASRGLKIVQTAARNYPSHRDCFSCHHQTLPLFAMGEARRAGLAIDEELATAVKDFTLKSFHSRLENLREGRRVGGRANTVSYGLWALDLAEHEADETTAAMVAYLLKSQSDNGRWAPPSHRPPLEESQVAVTVLSAYYMQQFADEHSSDDVEKAVHRTRAWLKDAALESQEDHNFRLWSLKLQEDAGDAKVQQQIAELRDKILAAQREDGGWSQIPAMESDAYATGQTLYVLRQIGLPSDAVFYRAGLDYLIRTQQKDGSWRVETRSKPVQVFFDNGDPHGKHQFISTAATSWAVASLASAKRD